MCERKHTFEETLRWWNFACIFYIWSGRFLQKKLVDFFAIIFAANFYSAFRWYNFLKLIFSLQFHNFFGKYFGRFLRAKRATTRGLTLDAKVTIKATKSIFQKSRKNQTGKKIPFEKSDFSKIMKYFSPIFSLIFIMLSNFQIQH